MAEGAWVPAFDTIWTSPKTRQLALDLKVTRYHAAGMFLHLMAWMRDSVDSGDLGPVSRAAIARAVGLATDLSREDIATARGEAFFRALVAARFISDDLAGHVTGWEDGPGKLVKSRRSDRLRKEHQRRSHKVTVADCPLCLKLSDGQVAPKPITTASITSGLHPLSAGQDDPVRRMSGVEKTRQEESRQEPHSPTAGAGHEGTNGPLARPTLEGIIGNATGVWRQALEELSTKQTRASFETWWHHTSLDVTGITADLRTGTTEQTRYVVTMPNEFAREFVSKRMSSQVREAIAKVTSSRTDEIGLTFSLEGGPREPDVVDVQ